MITALYAALLYYPEDQYWMNPEEAGMSPEYGAFGAAAGAADVLRGGEALHPTATAARIPAAWRGKVELRPVVPMKNGSAVRG